MKSPSSLNCILLSLVLVLGSAVTVDAQIQGPTTVYTNTFYTYSYDMGTSAVTATWTPSKGVASNPNTAGTIYYIDVMWTSTGTGVLKVFRDGTLEAQLPGIIITACGALAPTAVASSFTRCGSGTLTLQATPGSGGTSIRWYSVPTNGIALATGTSYTTPTQSSNTTYYFTTYNTTTGCESYPRTSYTTTINPLPGFPNLNTDISRCGPGTVTLTATGTDGNDQVMWYSDAVNGSHAGGGYLNIGTSYSPSISATTTYYLAIWNAVTNCERPASSRVALSGIVNPVPSTPAGTSGSRCGSGVVGLSASPGANGNAVRWYDLSSGGTLLTTSGSYGPSLSSTTTYYISSYNTTTGCESGRVSITATVNPIPIIPSASNVSRCGGGNVSLSGNVGANGTEVRWYDAVSGGNYLGSNTVSPFITVNTNFYASSYNSSSGCESSRITVTASINTVPAAPSAITNGASCGTGAVTISANPSVAGGNTLWYNASSGGTLLATATSYLTPTLSVTTNYWASTVNPTTGCEGGRTQVTATINPIPSAPGGTSGSRCGSGIVNLSGSPGANGNTLRWYDASSGGTLLATSTSYGPSISSTTTYYISTFNSTTSCESGRVSITATINPIPIIPNAPNVSRCGSGNITLSGNVGANGTEIRWYDAISGGNFLGSNTASPLITVNTNFYASSYNASTGCESTRITVSATINTVPAAPTSPLNGAVCGAGTVNLSANPGVSGGNIKWYDAASGGNLLATTPSSYTTLSISVTTNYWASTLNTTTGCEGSRIQLTATVNPIPSNPSPSATTNCGPGSMTLSATYGANGNSVRWYDAASGGLLLATALTYPTPSLSVTTTYYITSYNSTTGCESTRVANVATVNPIPSTPSTVNGGSRCGTGTIDLNGTPGANGNTLRWYAALTGGSSLATSTSYTTVSLGATTTYYVTTYNTTTLCESTATRVAVVATINTIPNAAAANQSICSGQATSVAITNPNNAGVTTYTWTVVPSNVTGAASGNGSTIAQTLSSTLGGTAIYTITPTANGCVGTPISATVTVNTVPGPPSVTGTKRFGAGAFLLTASGTPSGGTYSWYDPSNNLIPAGGVTYTTPSVSVNTPNYAYVKSVSNASCASTPTWVSLLIEPAPVVATTNNRVVFGASVTLDAGAGYTSYDWRNSSNAQVGTAQLYSTNVTGSYSVTVTKAGVTGTGTSAIFSIVSQLDGVNLNYIVSNAVLSPNVTLPNQIGTLTVDSLSQSIQYLDGLGRPMQTVIPQGSPLRKDIVQPNVYDQFGREAATYLPFVSTEANGLYKANPTSSGGGYTNSIHYNFYHAAADQIANDDVPYSQTIFEPSPLNRPIQQFGAGKDWKDNNKAVASQYLINQTSEVYLFGYDPNVGLVTLANGASRYYPAGELIVSKTTDENQNDAIEYVDKQGHKICKKVKANATEYASTYYIYDDMGHLVVVLPPEAVKKITQ